MPAPEQPSAANIRQHYDRFVHLCFGALLIVPARDLAVQCGRLTAGWSLVFAVCAVTTLSGLYEIFEWLLTVVMSPIRADAYNGQQGDAWDAQKDMALAFAGSLLTVILLAVCRKGREPAGKPVG